MFTLYRTLSLRYHGRRWFRTGLIAMSIALGVATLVATQALDRCMTRANQAAINPLPLTSSLQVENGETGVARELARQLQEAGFPGIKSVIPLVLGRAALPELDNLAVRIIGADLPPESEVAARLGVEVRFKSVHFRPGLKSALVGTELAKRLAPDTSLLRVRGGGQEHRVALVGSVAGRGNLAALGGNVLFMPSADAADLLGRPGLVSRVDLLLEPGTDVRVVRQIVENFLNGRAQTLAPEEGNTAYRDVMDGVRIGFQLGGVGALVVGLFLVYNVLSVSVAERRHDLGILRSLGSTRGQIAALFAGEAMVIGLVGSLLGLPLGAVLARWSLRPMQHALSNFFPQEVQQVEISSPLATACLLAGVLTALLAALVPALQAAWDQPADAVRRSPTSSRWVNRVTLCVVSLGLISAGVGCVLGRSYLPPRVGAFVGMVLTLMGALLAAPLRGFASARLLQPLVRRWPGVTERLAAENLSRSSGRTGLVVGALAAGVALVLQTAGTTASTEDTVLGWINESITADLFVTADKPVGTGSQNLPLPGELVQQVRSLPGVAAALPVRLQRVNFRNSVVLLVALDSLGYYEANRGLSQRNRSDLFQALRETNAAVVSENFAALHGFRVGDHFSLPTPTGPRQLRVAATLVDYSWNRGTVYVDQHWYREHYGDSLADVIDLFIKNDVDPENIRAQVLTHWGLENSLVVLTRPMLLDNVAGAIRGLYSLAYAQQVLLGIVACLGIVSALLISVLQRQRELGLLRAIGATRGQVLRSVLAEAAFMGLIGTVVGVLIGLALEIYVVKVLLPDESGFTFRLHIPWKTTGGIALFALGAALLAGLGPAWHAMRLRIAEAIAYE